MYIVSRFITVSSQYYNNIMHVTSQGYMCDNVIIVGNVLSLLFKSEIVFHISASFSTSVYIYSTQYLHNLKYAMNA